MAGPGNACSATVWNPQNSLELVCELGHWEIIINYYFVTRALGGPRFSSKHVWIKTEDQTTELFDSEHHTLQGRPYLFKLNHTIDTDIIESSSQIIINSSNHQWKTSLSYLSQSPCKTKMRTHRDRYFCFPSPKVQLRLRASWHRQTYRVPAGSSANRSSY